MNVFQKQLILNDKSMAELTGPHVGPVVPPAKVSVEEFLRDRSGKLLIPRTPDWGDTHTFQVRPWNEE